MSAPETRTTVGDWMDPAMAITEHAAADEYFEELVARRLTLEPPAGGWTRQLAETHVRHDLVYYAGYFSEETVARVRRLYRCYERDPSRPTIHMLTSAQGYVAQMLEHLLPPEGQFRMGALFLTYEDPGQGGCRVAHGTGLQSPEGVRDLAALVAAMRIATDELQAKLDRARAAVEANRAEENRPPEKTP